MRSWLARRSIAAKVVAIGMTGVVLIASGLCVTVAFLLRAEIERQAAAQLDIATTQGWDLLGRLDAYGSGFRVHDGKLYAGLNPLNEREDLVASLADAVGVEATIFLGDVRLVTTFRRADGSSAAGTRLAAGPAHDTVFRDGRPYRGSAEILGKRHLTAYEPLKARDGTVVGALFVGVPLDAIAQRVGRIIRMVCLVGVVATAAVGAAVFLAVRRLLSTLVRLTAVVGRLADNDTEVEIPGRERRDEIGRLAAATAVFRDNAITRLRLEAQQQDAEQQAAAEKRAALAALADGFEASVAGVAGELRAAALRMHDDAGTMATVSATTNDRSAQVSGAAGQALDNVQAVAAAAEQLSLSIAEIGSQVHTSATAAETATQEACRARDEVLALVGAVQKIGEVSGLIEQIASKTNLLALNATIEAARAGEAGRGFAVVASEVKALANQTARATEEIGRQIEEIQSVTDRAADAAGRIAATVGGLKTGASTIAAAVEEQGAATNEIARNIEHAACGTRAVVTNIAEVVSAAGETGAVASRAAEAARALRDQSEALSVAVERFIEGVRAA